MTDSPCPRAGGGPAQRPKPGCPGAGRGPGKTPRRQRRLAKATATAALLLLAACDPFQPDNVQAVIVTPESQCLKAGGTPATHKAKDGTPWRVCTFDDTRVCDIVKLRTDNRCYTTVPDSTSGT